jgi:hypothetical protein
LGFKEPELGISGDDSTWYGCNGSILDSCWQRVQKSLKIMTSVIHLMLSDGYICHVIASDRR